MTKPPRQTLFELNRMVRLLMESGLPDHYWVEAEIGEMHEHVGHCYFELIEKDEKSNTPIARASARCWKSKWALIKPYFLRTTGKQMTSGIKVLLNVYAQFHENYGFAWIIDDIDPAFTLGDMAIKRQRIIQQLKSEGVFDANKELVLPLFTQRIAVISSASAAGYGDFCNHLSDNEFGYSFQTTLYQATMQGEGVEASIIDALGKIEEHADEYDCIVITRGGGATSDLSGFDTLDLARNVVYSSLPIITAIGHDRDESVLDMISNVRVKTPTAAAAFLIDRLHHVDERISQSRERIVKMVQQRMQFEQTRLNQLAYRIPPLFAVSKIKQEAKIDAMMSRICSLANAYLESRLARIEKANNSIGTLVERRMTDEKHFLQLLSQRISSVDPQRVLERGYSITTHNGKTVKNISQLSMGCQLETRIQDGIVRSVVCDTVTSLENKR